MKGVAVQETAPRAKPAIESTEARRNRYIANEGRIRLARYQSWLEKEKRWVCLEEKEP